MHTRARARGWVCTCATMMTMMMCVSVMTVVSSNALLLPRSYLAQVRSVELTLGFYLARPKRMKRERRKTERTIETPVPDILRVPSKRCSAIAAGHLAGFWGYILACTKEFTRISISRMHCQWPSMSFGLVPPIKIPACPFTAMPYTLKTPSQVRSEKRSIVSRSV